MPYTASDAKKHISNANTPKKKRQWAKVWNSVYARTGSEQTAFAEAAAAVAKNKSK